MVEKVKFITLGCKVNQYETQALKEKFLKYGFKIVDKDPHLYVINTCAVTSKAYIKSKGAILKAQKENPQAKIAVVGCMVKDGWEDLKKMNVDFILPPQEKHLLPEKILGIKSENGEIWSLKITHFFNKRAFVKIQDGCDNFCSFCEIPYFRGRSTSRPKGDILEEIERLSLKHPEIVLCGINLALYGKEKGESLVSLIRDVLKIKTLKRLRLSSLEPAYVSDELLELFKNEKLCPHLHLPFQSGDDEILRLMNKKESVSLYKEIVKKARKINPLISITCDIMVGFPYEEDRHFSNTVKFLEEIRPMRMHIFSFSARPHTIFENIKLKKNWIIKMKERYGILRKLAEKFSYEYKCSFLGKTLFMVAEEEKNGYVCGYAQNYIRVFVEKKIPLGEIVKVRLKRIDRDRVICDAEK
ncbi:MAG: tRNA (N(6)-L-threonylcarbamoyladenosine(37)-C(2))-methylthiotransferase MtaB [Candidatus Omnitrophica bacterium 4484_70.2]|nr:MAG: tRNA (N(6)-L-threonylcarbamoyladenosine(37)-C(2))-methylthiotransferase MtaB [Candidatus Omnitrophica bacterium 4484_70.2]